MFWTSEFVSFGFKRFVPALDMCRVETPTLMRRELFTSLSTNRFFRALSTAMMLPSLHLVAAVRMALLVETSAATPQLYIQAKYTVKSMNILQGESLATTASLSP